VAIGEALRDWPIRITYDRGEMEFTTTSSKHERGGHLWGRLVCVLTEELNINMEAGGGMTFQREDLERGFEPDECYWIEHEPQMRHKDSYDSKTDPPPDLALEVEITRSALNRMSIYAAMRIPEVWRWDGKKIHIHVLSGDSQYVESAQSRAFPFLPVQELVRFVNMRNQLGTTALVRAFRAWVREQQAKGWRDQDKPKSKRRK
jgi:Uma2 family endonuclease